jgi:D-alanine transaminase
MERLRRSAEGLHLKLDYDGAAMSAACVELARQSGLTDGTVYIQVTRGADRRSHLPSARLTGPTTLAYTRSGAGNHQSAWESGLSAITAADDRWGHCNLKTIALLPNVLAKMEAERQGADEAIYYGPQRHVYEGVSFNVFAVIGGTAYTHPPGPKILDGITRMAILEVCEKAGIPCVEQPRTVEEFYRADEVFLSSTTRDAFPLTSIDGNPIGTGKPGPVTRRIFSVLRELLERETR